VGNAADWEKAESALKGWLTNAAWPSRASRRGAFYGPKIDIKLVDVLGRLWQLSDGAVRLPTCRRG